MTSLVMMQCVVMLSAVQHLHCDAGCQYTKCCYAECIGAIIYSSRQLYMTGPSREMNVSLAVKRYPI
jgi:hypothetical protein